MTNHETNHRREDGTYVSYSTYAHPYQLQGQNGFKTRTYRSKEAMDKAAAKLLQSGTGFRILSGHRHFKPKGSSGHSLRVIELYYPPAEAEEYGPYPQG